MGHSLLKGLTAYKKSKVEKNEKYFLEEKENLKKFKIETFSKNDSLNIYNQMLSDSFEYYNSNDNIKVELNLFRTTQSFILEERWKYIVTATTQNLKEIF